MSFEDDVQEVKDDVVSDARAARKEAQEFVEDLRALVSDLAAAITGRSGLDAEGKAQALADAHAKAQAVTAKSEEATAAVQRALAAV